MKTIQKIRKLNHINRCSLFPLLKPTTVAEHSYHVAVLAMFVCEEFKQANVEIDELKVLKRALCHDVEESIISDIPYTVKKHLGASVKAALCKLLNCPIEGFPEDAPEWLLDAVVEECDGSLEHKVVKLCDMVELCFYCVEEIELGNKSVKPMLDTAVEFSLRLNNEVRSYLIGNYLDCLSFEAGQL